MKAFSLFFVSAAMALAASSASAQIVSAAQFTGQQSDGFETQNSPGFNTCVLGRVFNSTADLCDPTGNAMLITSGWGFQCSISPHAGSRFTGSAGGAAEYTFDAPATRFGGFFGTNCGTADGVVEFYDVGNVLISSHPITAPANCTWTWNGWQVTGGPAIKRAKVISNFGGGFMDMDSMEVDYGPVCPTPSVYCIAKTTANGCVPAIGSSGTPSATAGTGFMVNGTGFINNKSCLLFYGVSGQATTPFQGGTLCVKSPIKRTPGTNTFGNPPPNDCSGVPSIDMNLFAVGGGGGTPLPELTVVGTVVDCQWWGRDPGFVAPNNTMLSNGLEYTVCP
jgi:hypothetical protein